MFGDEGYGRHTAAPTGWRRNGVIGITATVLMAGGLLLAAASTDGAGAAANSPAANAPAANALAAKTYKNCTALNEDYPHGVGRKSAIDKVSGNSRPVTNFKKSNALYEANRKSDRDRDKIACEKR